MRTRVLAVLAFTAFVAMLILNVILRPDPNAPGGWLFQEASPTLIKMSASIAALYYAGWAVFLVYKRYAEQDLSPGQWIAAHPDPPAQDQPRVTALRPSRRPSAPTQPLPTPPDEAPTVVNE